MHTSMEALRPPLTRPAGGSSSLFFAPAGAAVFGVAMALPSQGSSLLSSGVTWAAALPLLGMSTWLICVPALYIPWAAREPRLQVGAVASAAVVALGTFGTCLGATAPIQWFFAVTAPRSAWVPALGFMFLWLAMIAGNVSFARRLESQGLQLPIWAQVLFFALYATTFFQFGHMAGLQFFPS